MKALRSPWVSGTLALIAVAVVAAQFGAFRWPAAVAVIAPHPAPAPAPAPPIPQPAPKTTAERPEPPALPVERQFARARFEQCLEAPRRDPFRLVPVFSGKAAHQYPSPVLVWKLKAIWRQTNGRVAAINNGVYAEGDKLDGYLITKIEAEQVWFDGPDGPEALTFAPPGSTPGKGLAKAGGHKPK